MKRSSKVVVIRCISVIAAWLEGFLEIVDSLIETRHVASYE
jgi:hypothetical protein